MARDLRFTDPAFRCEVVLSGAAAALYEGARPQFERLKRLRSLGLMAHVHEVAMHTRHQHAIGLMRLFNKLCEQPKRKGLPKEFLWSFWCRLCFGQTGHAALSYDSEKAVLLACHLDAGFKARLRALLQPVIDRLAPCATCARTSCIERGNGATEANVWFEDLVTRNRWGQLHRWVAALKLLQEPKLLSILRTQVVTAANPIGFAEAEALKMMVAPRCEWTKSFRNLNRLDFIVRDLAFAGSLGIQLDVDSLVASANAEHPDWGLLESLSTYMSDTLYESLSAQTTSALLQRLLADLLIRGKVTLEALFGVALEGMISDEDLRRLLEKRASGRDIFDRETRGAWRTWEISTYVEEGVVPSEIEKRITGSKAKHLTDHTSARATCVRLTQRRGVAVAMCHQGLADRPTAGTFVKLCRSVLEAQYPKLASEDLTSALFDGLVDRHCEHGLERVCTRLGALGISLETLRAAANVVNTRAASKAAADKTVSFKIGDYEYPLRGNPQELQLNAMHAALSGSDDVRKSLDMTVEDAAEVLWQELLSWQTIYFGARRGKEVIALVDAAQKVLGTSVVSGGADAAADLEAYALLEALRHPGKGATFRVALPNVKLLGEDGNVENEYDTVSIALKGASVEVWIWGVTTEANLATKRAADFKKIQRLKDLLGGRWEADVKVATSYVHREGTEVCLEVDGVQQRRGMGA